MKAIVVEDSRLAREGLMRMLSAFAELELAGAAANVVDALALVQQVRPEVIFLDIHLAGDDGFALLEQLDYLPRVVFTTAYSEYAIRSFDYHTIDYLVKPISPERLAQAVDKLLCAPAANAPRPPLEAHHRILLREGEQTHLVRLDQIRYFESCKNYVQVYFGERHAYVKKAMNSVEERLPKDLFFRASRQHIINLQAVRKMEESISQGYAVTLDNGKVLEISRRNAAELKEMLSL
jgi:two-component system LytT family response regulator